MDRETGMDQNRYDVIVAGSGAAGLTAALVAAEAGLRVLVIEKADVFGGTTALSGGGAWVPCNPSQPEVGMADTLDEARTYLQAVMGNLYDEAKIDAFLENGPKMAAFMREKTEVQFDNWQSGDYKPWLPGAARGRSIGVTEFDGRRLDRADLDRIRPPLKQLTIFGGMQVGYADAPQFANVLRSWQAFGYTTRKFLRYLGDRAIHRRPTRLVLGNALIAALILSCRKAGVTLWHSSPLTALDRDATGRVTGVQIERDGREMRLSADRGVVLAAGGYGANDDLRQRYIPQAQSGYNLQAESDSGDGLRAGTDAGGQIISDNAANAIYAPFSTMRTARGELVHFPHNVRDRSFPGFILVDLDAQRFVNEGCSYQDLGQALIEKNLRKVWLIGDHKAVRRYGIGHAKPFPLPIGSYLRNGYLRKGSDIRSLAAEIALDPSALEATVTRFNHFAQKGEDPDFHKGEDGYSREQGDPSHAPNPAVGPLTEGPFYAVALRPSQLCSMNGLEVDPQARVLDAQGQPVPGLFAAGIDSNSVFRGTYPGGGASIGPGMTFGFIAARQMSSEAPGSSSAAS